MPGSYNQEITVIEAETHARRAQRQQEMEDVGVTGALYSRWTTEYDQTWKSIQFDCMNEDSNWQYFPSYPITATKVAVVMEIMDKQNKRNHLGSDIPNSSLGKDSIKQCISTLESERSKTAHLYRNDPDAQRGLQEDSRIWDIEKAALMNETEWLQLVQSQKAQGTLADTYTIEQQMAVSDFRLSRLHGNSNMSRHKAYISDLYGRNIPNPKLDTMDWRGKVDHHHDIEAVVFLADKGKMNKHGCTFHVIKKPIPNFVPDFDDPKVPENGDRSWYNLLLFPGGNGDDNTKALGLWSASGSYQAYDHGLPIKGILTASHWSANSLEKHALIRALIGKPIPSSSASRAHNRTVVPLHLTDQLWPWVEDEFDGYKERYEANPKARDTQLENFLNLLKRLRKILCQDLAILHLRNPSYTIFDYAPFDSPEFRALAVEAAKAVEEAADNACLQLGELHPQLKQSL
ncbi:hypothetical protein PQX77_019641 [Marasmius sp. AFHP31]|nr:hypothetical protein PQX77_019641 [Marasmius sp. AFHP31]